ncbi:MAG TPA: hypothetical protein ENN84_06895 [Candidatus Marinimicrobia bacterium]|nr:hypothetical protein [Candidatus Neomarinimicrobiota bacterium]
MNAILLNKNFSAGAYFTAFAAFLLMMILLLLNHSSDPFHECLNLEKEKSIPLFVSVYFFLDFVLVTGWLLGWPGIISILKIEKNRLLQGLFVGGILGPLLDYAETMLSIIIMLQDQSDKLTQNTLYQVWSWLSGLSYLIPYITAMALGIVLLKKIISMRWVAWICMLGLPLGFFGYLWPLTESVTYLWWPLWFLSLGIFAARS